MPAYGTWHVVVVMDECMIFGGASFSSGWCSHAKRFVVLPDSLASSVLACINVIILRFIFRSPGL